MNDWAKRRELAEQLKLLAKEHQVCIFLSAKEDPHVKRALELLEREAGEYRGPPGSPPASDLVLEALEELKKAVS